MTNHERLREQYEDALFALLMEGVAESEGEEALRLNEELKKDPNAEVPKDVQKRCEKTIRSAFARKQFRTTGRTAIRWLTRVAVVAVLGGVMFTAAFALSEDVRVATLNALIQVMDDRTQITFEGTNEGAKTAGNQSSSEIISGLEYHYNIALEWLPDGYTIMSGSSDTNGDKIIYTDNNGSEIFISIDHYSPDLVYTFDSEDAEQKNIEVQGHPATLYVTNKQKLLDVFGSDSPIWSSMTVFWTDDNTETIWYVSATNLTEDEIIYLVNGLHWKK